jgi:peptide-methionine (S)-S-oxide reductase
MIINISNKEDFQTLLKSEKPILLDFYAEWCGPCKALLPTVEKLADKHKEDFAIAKINVDTNGELAQEYSVRSIPALFFLKDGKIQEKLAGLQTEEVLESKIQMYLDKESSDSSSIKKAYIAGGCFWGMEDLFRVRPGVVNTEVGYQGGENDNPTYRNHPGHAEGIEITYDSDVTSLKELLDFFFRIHNPTTVDRQGNDRGSSYRSAIFYQNDEEKTIAEEVIKIVNDSKKWDGTVVTTLEPFAPFWQAEPEHQDYLVRNPNGYTCHYLRFEESFI